MADDKSGVSYHGANAMSNTPLSENIAQSADEGKADPKKETLRHQLYEKLKADKYPRLKKCVDLLIDTFYNAKMKNARKDSIWRDVWGYAKNSIDFIQKHNFDDAELSKYEESSLSNFEFELRRLPIDDTPELKQKLYEKFDFDKHPVLKEFIDFNLKIYEEEVYADGVRITDEKLEKLLKYNFSDSEIELFEKILKWEDAHKERFRWLHDEDDVYFRSEYYQTAVDILEKLLKNEVTEEYAHNKIEEILSYDDRLAETKKIAQKLCTEFLEKKGIPKREHYRVIADLPYTLEWTSKKLGLIDEMAWGSICSFETREEAESFAKYFYEKLKPLSIIDEVTIIDQRSYEHYRLNWINEHKFTYDENKSVEENMAAAEKIAQEYLDNFGTTANINTRERIKLRRQIIEELYGDGAQKKERKAFLIMGLPASGKSTIADSVAKENGALIIDSDMAKEKLPEFNGGILANAVHDESTSIANRILDSALLSGDNVVLPIVGSYESDVQEKIQRLKSEGYKVNLYHVALPLEKTLERTQNRFKETGRLVSTNYIKSVGTKPKENYDKLKNQEEVNSYAEWSNDVDRGQRPRLLERSERTQDAESGLGLGRTQLSQGLDERNGTPSESQSTKQGERKRSEQVDRTKNNGVAEDKTESVYVFTKEEGNIDDCIDVLSNTPNNALVICEYPNSYMPFCINHIGKIKQIIQNSYEYWWVVSSPATRKALKSFIDDPTNSDVVKITVKFTANLPARAKEVGELYEKEKFINKKLDNDTTGRVSKIVKEFGVAIVYEGDVGEQYISATDRIKAPYIKVLDEIINRINNTNVHNEESQEEKVPKEYAEKKSASLFEKLKDEIGGIQATLSDKNTASQTDSAETFVDKFLDGEKLPDVSKFPTSLDDLIDITVRDEKIKNHYKQIDENSTKMADAVCKKFVEETGTKAEDDNGQFYLAVDFGKIPFISNNTTGYGTRGLSTVSFNSLEDAKNCARYFYEQTKNLSDVTVNEIQIQDRDSDIGEPDEVFEIDHNGTEKKLEDIKKELAELDAEESVKNSQTSDGSKKIAATNEIATKKAPSNLNECKNFEDVKNYWAENYDVKVDDTVGYLKNFEPIKEFLIGVESVINHFPFITKSLNFIKANYISTNVFLGIVPAAFTIKGQVITGLLVNPEYFNDAESIKKTNELFEKIKTGKESPIWYFTVSAKKPSSNATPFTTLGVHETGHLLESYLHSKIGIVPLYLTKQLRHLFVEWVYLSYNKTTRGIRSAGYDISQYARKDDTELIAEAISDYFVNGEDAEEFSKALWKQLNIALTTDEWINFVHKRIVFHNLDTESTLKWAENLIKENQSKVVEKYLPEVIYDKNLSDKLKNINLSLEEKLQILRDHIPNKKF